MIKAFVFGKFHPFHKGHEAMIRFALTHCDFLSVLVCCSDKENIPDTQRCAWIRKTFECENRIEVRAYNYLESDLPNTSVSSQTVSMLWSEIFKNEFPDYSLLVTSEAYGDYVAEFMGIRHICFDLAKNLYPVSATAVRTNLAANWNFLPNSVKPYFSIKVVLLGTESTGKTWLAKRLSDHFKASLVLEAARDIIANSNSFCMDDLQLVAKVHAQMIDQAAQAEYPLVIIDTDIHITKSYSRFCFSKELDVSESIYQSNQANLYLYLNKDVPFIQDGTRLNETERDLLDASHRQTLADHQIDFLEIKGDWQQRFEKAVEAINRLMISN